jgi:hypothetical protein
LCNVRIDHTGGITVVKDYVPAQWLRHREVFMPLRLRSRHWRRSAGGERNIHFSAMDLSHRDVCFVH